MKLTGRFLCLILCLACPTLASAHGFGALYNLPVPLWLYNWAAAATLVVSFLITIAVVAKPSSSEPVSKDLSRSSVLKLLGKSIPLLRILSLLLLFLCIATGFWGNPDPMRNFNPVFFWIIITLALTYLIALVGDVYAAINPFRTLTNGLRFVGIKNNAALFRYPEHWGVWPALALYLCFIWFELFGTGTPKSIAWFLLGYTLLNIVGVRLIGARDWFEHCEFFSVFFRLVAKMAPIDYRRGIDGGPGHLRLRWPLAGLLHERPAHISTAVFVLAMLSTTAFDGLTATKWWVELFWGDPTGLIKNMVGTEPAYAMATVMPWYLAWKSFWLFASPFLYFGLFIFVLWVGKKVTGSERSVKDLTLDFSYSLLPIVLMYHITHYWTLILSHGLKVFSLISDPFGWRWDLFGTAFKFRAPIIPDMGFVWHSQVALIILGHIASVWIAHKVALRVFPSRASTMVSQLPVLVLMILFTTVGLWILAQPLTVELMR